MPRRAVVDTVVLRYFLFVDRADLLLEILGVPVTVPRSVFDPDDGDVPDEMKSEITQSVAYQRRVATDRARSDAARDEASFKADRLSSIRELHGGGSIEVIDLTQAELVAFGRLSSTEPARELGLKFALGAGEAACIAVAVERDWVPATDDNDALTALRSLRPRHPFRRIRRVLREAVEHGLLARAEANRLHAEMRRLGFSDTGVPFPKG